MLGAHQVIGIDVTPELLDVTRRRAELDHVSDRVVLQCGDICDLQPQPVDIVLAYAVLHHVPDRLEEVVSALRRWLKPGGSFICVEPVSYLPWLQWLRQHSGVPQEPLDPGERELMEADLRLIEREFASSRRHHFNAWARLSRLWPDRDRAFRRFDNLFLRAPAAKKLAGTVMLICS
jgi:SAM-dependent methyltransferase